MSPRHALEPAAVPRILHIISTFDRTGVGTQSLLLAGGLVRGEFDVHVCALGRGGPLRAEFRDAGIPTAVIGRRLSADPIAFIRLLRHIRRLAPDLVHTWGFAAGRYGRTAARLAGVKHLVAGEYGVDEWKTTAERLIDRRLAHFTDRFVTNCAAIPDGSAADGSPVERFAVIAGGVPPGRSSDVSRGELLRELSLPDDARLVGVVNRLRPSKRVKDLIWAADLLRVLHDNLRLLVIGDGPERATLEQFARLASNLEHIRLLGHRDDLWRILPHFDIFWNGSRDEGQSMAVMEAMAAGVPVVASDIASHRSLVVHGETGFLVPVAGRAARARATDQLLNDSALAAELGANARRRMLEQFNVEASVRRHEELYREVLAGALSRNAMP